MSQLADSLDLADSSADAASRLARCREYLKRSYEWINRYHRSGGSGLRVVQCRSIAMDVLVERLHAIASARIADKLGEKVVDVAVIALGGYGRSELCPFSDIDLMFLYPARVRSPKFPETQRLFNDTILYMLWDLNLKVGHSTRTIKEAIAEADNDEQSKNAMLEARFICGNQPLYRKFSREYDRFIRRDNVLAYIEERLTDQTNRREKQGNSVFIQEPDIKNGVGGLRDYQNILWMSRLQFDGRGLQALVDLKLIRQSEHDGLWKAYDFLLRVRNELHFQSKRPSDVLDFEKQPRVALGLGYRQRQIFARVETFMRDYYKAAYRIYHLSTYLEKRLSINARTSVTFQSVLESRRLGKIDRFDGFEAHGKYLLAESAHVFHQDPVRLIRVFRHLQSRGLEADFDLERLIEENLDLIDKSVIESEQANRAFRSILQTKGEVFPVLQLMNSTGVLSRFMPEWAGLHCLVQHEFYHRYTADAHVLATIEELDRLISGEESGLTRKYREALEDTELPGLLYLILLLHDIGKARGIEQHAIVGAEIAGPILKRLGVVEKVRQKILFQIENHLEMARIWQKHDLDDPKTIQILCDLVGNAETLRYLYVLTFCDARGTSRSLWNSFKDSLHTQLFKQALQQFQSPSETPNPLPMISQTAILKKVDGISEDEVEAHFNLLPDRYFSYHSEQEVLMHLRMIHTLFEKISTADSVGALVPVIEWEDDLNLGLTVVHIVTWDRAGLFYKLAGAFTLAGLSIVSSKALSRADHISIDTFYVSDPGGGPVKDASAFERFRHFLEEALIHNRNLLDEIRAEMEKRRRPSYIKTDTVLPAPIPVRVDVYHELSLKRTIIEIEANDDLGLLYEVARTISDHGFDITFARISTERRVAVDTFYIQPSEPLGESGHSQDLVELKEALLHALQQRAEAVRA
jgi:[protein-PII] uridylyltransferase